jgi:hypothetical protein
MPRVLRRVLGDGLFHVTTVAVDQTPAFFDDVDRVAFLRLLAECVHVYSAACRDVLLNPVRAGLCERAADWPWSGSRYGKTP